MIATILLFILVVLMIRNVIIYETVGRAIDTVYREDNWEYLRDKHLDTGKWNKNNQFYMVLLRWDCWTYSQFYKELEEELKK